MRIWTKVTNDEYELVVAIADSCVELAKICGVEPNSISSAISHAKKYGKRSIYQVTEIGDEDAEQ